MSMHEEVRGAQASDVGSGRRNDSNRSFRRAAAILDALAHAAEVDGASLTLTQLAGEIGLAKSTVHRLLRGLLDVGLVGTDPEGRYILGRSLIRKGELARRSHSSLAAVQDSVRRIAALTGDTAFYTERTGSIGICVWREDGNGPFRNNVLSVGDQHPLGIGAGSLAILAALPAEEAAQIMDDNLAVFDEQGQSGQILRSTAFAQALEEARSQGWAVNTGMVVDESWAVGVALPQPAEGDQSRGGPLLDGALSVASVRSRLRPPRLERIVEALQQEARRLTAPARADTD